MAFSHRNGNVEGMFERIQNDNQSYQRCLKRLSTVEGIEDDSTLKQVTDQVSLNNALSQVVAKEKSNGTTEAAAVEQAKRTVVTAPSDIFQGMAARMKPITREGGLLKLIIRTGFADCDVAETDYVNYHYTGWQNGKDQPFTSSRYERKSVQRQIGTEGSAFEGMDLALRSMKKGETAFFLTCPEYSYGPRGAGVEVIWPGISAGEWLLWKIEIINVIPAASYVADVFSMREDDRMKWPFSEIITVAESQRQLGIEAFNAKKYAHAKRCFERAAKLLVEDRLLSESEVVQKKSLLSKLFCNIAVALFKEEETTTDEEHRNYQDVYENAESASSFDENNARAWFWGGKALRLLDRLEESLEFLKKAAKLQPGNVEVGRELEALDKDFVEQRKREDRIYKKMVGKKGETGDKISSAIENAVPISFRTWVEKELKGLADDEDDLVQFDLSLFNRAETNYIEASVASLDKSKFKTSRFKTQSSSDIIDIEKC